MGNEGLLERWVQEYATDPVFIAEGLATAVMEEALTLLEQRDLSRSWLARTMGVSPASVSRMLAAPPTMTLLSLAKMAVALGVKPKVILDTT